jgi:hypothetical protein
LSTQRNILLLTSADPMGSGIGSLFIRDFVTAIPEIKVTYCYQPPFLLGTNRAPFPVRLYRSALVRMGWLQAARLAVFRRTAIKERVTAAAQQARSDGAECIWVTAFSPELIAVAARLAEHGHDLRVMVLDAPEYLATNLRLPASARRKLNADFELLLRKAKTVAVISAALQRDYLARFGVHSEIIRHGIYMDAPLQRVKSQEDLRIVFAGSLYSKAEWNALVIALSSARWQLGGRRVRLYFMGAFPIAGAVRPAEVKLLGQLPFDKALDTMADMHIGYLPYWFSKEHELAARTSFPGKMSAYAAAGLAVFHHAPNYTEATEFLSQHPFGIACPTLETNGIIKCLEDLARHMNTAECHQAREKAFVTELSAKAMAVRGRRFLRSAEPKRSNFFHPDTA